LIVKVDTSAPWYVQVPVMKERSTTSASAARLPSKAALLDETIVSTVRNEGSERPLREQMQEALAAPAARLLELFAEINA
jgi:hypothetical protein